MLKMTDLHDLQTRAGHVEKAVHETDDQRGNLLSGLQDGLSTVRDRFIRMRIENDRLTEENTQLKEIVEQLLEFRENHSKDAWHDKLTGLDAQLNVLIELSGDDGVALDEDLGMGLVWDTKSIGADGGTDEPGGVVSSEPNGSSLAESRSLSDIQNRVRELSVQLRGDDGQTKAPRPATESSGPEPVSFDQKEPTESFGRSTSQDQMSRALGKETQAPCNPDNPHRKTFNRLIETAAHTARGVLPKTRMRFDAEVEYALGILRRLKREGQSFSVEQVRDLINGKFDLGLTTQHDAQITASLSKQHDVRPNAIRGTGWKFRAA
jgi:hypothetical protein